MGGGGETAVTWTCDAARRALSVRGDEPKTEHTNN